MTNENVPKLRFPGFDESYETKSLGDLFDFLSTNSYSRANLNEEEGNIKNIHYGDIHTKFPTLLNCEKVNIPFINSNIDLSKISNDSYCKNGDLIIADASEDYEDIGKAIELKNIKDTKILAGLHTLLARDNSNNTAEGYRCYMFLNPKLKSNIKKIANGISVLGISKINLSKLEVKLPSLEEQKQIGLFLSKIDEKIDFLNKKYVEFLNFKKFLMQNLFT
ncbi:MAG: restriction endonuclease subunit S, partial [Methanobacteriaceae archaeon]|nr:restriction endonuclease subunit S [Methanobacteriaceae archaeon]